MEQSRSGSESDVDYDSLPAVNENHLRRVEDGRPGEVAWVEETVLSTCYVEGDTLHSVHPGELDQFSVPSIKGLLHHGLSNPAVRRVEVDFTKTTFVDSTTLGVLMGAFKRVKNLTGGELVVKVSSPDLAKIFEITLLDRIFNVKLVDKLDDPVPQEPYRHPEPPEILR